VKNMERKIIEKFSEEKVKIKNLIPKNEEKLSSNDKRKLSELLLSATREGDYEKVKKLIEEGADVNMKDWIGWTPLHLACWWDHKDYESIMILLIEKGANVNAKDNYGNTPLHLTAIQGYTRRGELLIKRGADVNAKDKIGRAPLHRVAEKNYKEFGEMLIKNGADKNAKDIFYRTPYDIARAWNNKEIADLLIN
jgi:ankyrin repeat protein